MQPVALLWYREAMDPSCLVSLVNVPAMVESLASLGLSTVDLLCAVRLHSRCSLREARQILADLAPAVQEPDLFALP